MDARCSALPVTRIQNLKIWSWCHFLDIRLKSNTHPSRLRFRCGSFQKGLVFSITSQAQWRLRLSQHQMAMAKEKLGGGATTLRKRIQSRIKKMETRTMSKTSEWKEETKNASRCNYDEGWKKIPFAVLQWPGCNSRENTSRWHENLHALYSPLIFRRHWLASFLPWTGNAGNFFLISDCWILLLLSVEDCLVILNTR